MTTWDEVSGLTWDELCVLYTWDDLAGKNIYAVIAGENVGNIRRDSLSIQHRIEERSVASFQIVDEGDGYYFEYGQEVLIYDFDGLLLFGGLINEAKKMAIKPDWSVVVHDISCTDYQALADRRVFLGAYEEATGAEIVYDILAVLAEDGVRDGNIQLGEDLENLSFNRVMCSEALDKVAELCGFTWFIDEFKQLYFIARGTYPSAWQITDGSKIRRGQLDIINGNPEYRNVQYIQGGQAITSLQTEPFTGDGVERNFTLNYPPAKQPVITLNGNPQTIGIKGVNTSGFDYYWSKGDLVVAQDYGGTVLEATDTLIIQYYGTYKLIAKASQYAEITRQKIAQGFGSGKIENVTKDAAVQSQDSAIAMARAKLLHYASIGVKIRYETFYAGLAAGVVQDVNYVAAGLVDKEMLITSIDIGSEKGKIVYRIEACTGPVEDSWEKIFCRLADETKRQSADSLGEADVIQGLEEFSKIWYSTDHPNPFLSVDSSGTPADIDFPCLTDADKLSYCVLYTGGVEFFRKPITSQTIGAAQIDTICLILAEEANNVLISHVGLWGGDACSSTAGTGIEMEKHEFITTKNSLESLQFNFTDTYEA
ncbi:MAG: hypothetical protein WC455_27010 [Dehalococcoidia bacterium]|jgi:hypothetical protein